MHILLFLLSHEECAILLHEYHALTSDMGSMSRSCKCIDECARMGVVYEGRVLSWRKREGTDFSLSQWFWEEFKKTTLLQYSIIVHIITNCRDNISRRIHWRKAEIFKNERKYVPVLWYLSEYPSCETFSFRWNESHVRKSGVGLPTLYKWINPHSDKQRRITCLYEQHRICISSFRKDDTPCCFRWDRRKERRFHTRDKLWKRIRRSGRKRLFVRKYGSWHVWGFRVIPSTRRAVILGISSRGRKVPLRRKRRMMGWDRVRPEWNRLGMMKNISHRKKIGRRELVLYEKWKTTIKVVKIGVSEFYDKSQKRANVARRVPGDRYVSRTYSRWTSGMSIHRSKKNANEFHTRRYSILWRMSFFTVQISHTEVMNIYDFAVLHTLFDMQMKCVNMLLLGICPEISVL